jgi:tetratricopeptide (TPR) repeat protein
MGAPGTQMTDDIMKVSNNNNNNNNDTMSHSTTLSTYLSLIQQYLGVFMNDNAAWLAERCVAEYPHNAEALYLLGLSYYRMNKPQAARQVLERVPPSASTGPMLYLAAQCSLDLKEYTRAEEALLQTCRATFKQGRTADGFNMNNSRMTMDEWILHTTVRCYYVYNEVCHLFLVVL